MKQIRTFTAYGKNAEELDKEVNEFLNEIPQHSIIIHHGNGHYSSGAQLSIVVEYEV